MTVTLRNGVVVDDTSSINQQTASIAVRPASPTTGTAVATTGATNSSPYGFTTAAQADAIVTQLNIVIAALKAAGILA